MPIEFSGADAETLFPAAYTSGKDSYTEAEVKLRDFCRPFLEL